MRLRFKVLAVGWTQKSEQRSPMLTVLGSDLQGDQCGNYEHYTRHATEAATKPQGQKDNDWAQFESLANEQRLRDLRGLNRPGISVQSNCGVAAGSPAPGSSLSARPPFQNSRADSAAAVDPVRLRLDVSAPSGLFTASCSLYRRRQASKHSRLRNSV